MDDTLGELMVEYISQNINKTSAAALSTLRRVNHLVLVTCWGWPASMHSVTTPSQLAVRPPQGGGTQQDCCKHSWSGRSVQQAKRPRMCTRKTSRISRFDRSTRPFGDLTESIYRPGNLCTSSSHAVAFDFTASLRNLFNLDLTTCSVR